MNTELLPLIGGVITASVVGSLHCAGMCGAFVAMAVGLDTKASRTRLHAAYNLGRLGIYASIGAVFGLLGGVLDMGGQALGLEQAAIGVAAASMIAIGCVALLRASGVQLPRIRGPQVFEQVFLKLHALTRRLSPTTRAAVIGLLTGLLPCGWLYAFALLAAGTASPAAGALVMAAFWAGTLPMLVALGAGIRELSGRLGSAAPVAMGIVILALGVITALQRTNLTFTDLAEHHQGRARTVSLPSTNDLLPCCDIDHDAEQTP